MANLQADLVTTQAAALTGLSDGHVNAEFLGGVILHAIAVLDVAAAVTSDTFELTPPGYTGLILLPELSTVTPNQDPGSALVIDVGDAGNADRYSDGLVLSAVGAGVATFLSASGTLPEALLTRYRFTEPTAITGLIATATSITAGTKLVFNLAFLAKA